MNRHQVRFDSSNGLSLVVLLGSSAARMTDGYGGWEVVDRPKRTGLTNWKGRPPYKMEVPILFDGWQAQVGQEIKISVLTRMALPPGAPNAEPPTLRVSGAVPRDDVTWVIEAIDFGDNVIYDMVGGVHVRLRQDAVVRLIEYVKDERIGHRNSPATRASGNAGRSTTVKAGETLRQIASREYRDPNKWTAIAAANAIGDPRRIIAGQVLRLP